ncbi:hypothetical protein EV424DRAFT_1566508 [Suillus variegatus]|nr:hypothetical protein EV424DRAFT_1566508 [Suillus variegatus]
MEILLGKGTNSNLSHVAASNYVPQAPTISGAPQVQLQEQCLWPSLAPGPLFDKILPLLMEHTLKDQEYYLLVKVIDRVLYKLDDLVCLTILSIGLMMQVAHVSGVSAL